MDGGGASLSVPALLFPPELSCPAEAALSNLHGLFVAKSNDEPYEHVEPGGKAKRWIAQFFPSIFGTQAFSVYRLHSSQFLELDGQCCNDSLPFHVIHLLR